MDRGGTKPLFVALHGYLFEVPREVASRATDTTTHYKLGSLIADPPNDQDEEVLTHLSLRTVGGNGTAMIGPPVLPNVGMITSFETISTGTGQTFKLWPPTMRESFGMSNGSDSVGLRQPRGYPNKDGWQLWKVELRCFFAGSERSCVTNDHGSSVLAYEPIGLMKMLGYNLMSRLTIKRII
jgi:hypothetical protein